MKILYDVNFNFSTPFDEGIKHFKVAFASESKINDLIRDQVLNFTRETTISLSDRCWHFFMGVLETVGIIIPVIPYIVSLAERYLYAQANISQQSGSQASSLRGNQEIQDNIIPPPLFSPTIFENGYFNKIAGFMRTKYESPVIASIIEQFESRPPRNPFELHIYDRVTECKNAYDNIYFIDEEVNDGQDDGKTAEKVTRGQGLCPEEAIALWCPYTDKHIYGNINQLKTKFPIAPFLDSSLALRSYYLENNKNVVFSDIAGLNRLNEKSAKGRILISTEPTLLSGENEILVYVANYLKNELYAYPNERPQQIIMPLGVTPKRGTIPHAITLIIEPSATILNKATIRMINTHGNSITTYNKLEKVAMEAAQCVYDHPETQCTRNEESLWATGSCSHNQMELILNLVDEFSKGTKLADIKLKKNTRENDMALTKKHAIDIEIFLNSYK